MSAADAQAEPTMEEILASIRRIISEDDAPAAPQEAANQSDDFPEDVLELTEPEPETHVAPDFDFDALPTGDDEPMEELAVFDREEEPVFEEPAPVEAAPRPAPPFEPLPAREPARTIPPAYTEGLVGEPAAYEAASQFSRLSPQNGLPGQFISGNTVEALVAEMLRPLLKEWLDANLPRIVEEKVEAEVSRIARRGI